MVSSFNRADDKQLQQITIIFALREFPRGDDDCIALVVVDLRALADDDLLVLVEADDGRVKLDLDTVKKAFAPYCTEVVEVTTAENFN